MELPSSSSAMYIYVFILCQKTYHLIQGGDQHTSCSKHDAHDVELDVKV